MVERQRVKQKGPFAWLLTIDRRHARLLACERTRQGRLHIDELAAIEEEWDELQHGRPSPRAGKDGHSYADVGREEEERLRRFAREGVFRKTAPVIP